MFVNRHFHQISTKTKEIQNFHKRCIQLCAPALSQSTSLNNQNRRRVVVTGVGIISPVGCNTELAWQNIQKGFCGIKQLKDPGYESLPCKIAAKIDDNDLKLSETFSKSELRSLAPATAYALMAGKLVIMYNNCFTET